MTSILITQCLQNDFIKPVEIHEPLPNLLHVGFDESKRLLGEVPEEGLLFQLMNWAYKNETSNFQIINIRDWHNPSDLFQKRHLEIFGQHCIQNTKGAEFVFEKLRDSNKEIIIDSIGLNDFIESNLAPILDSYKGQEIKIGLIGVWTEAKITFLAYELATRYPEFKIAICSALTASSSTHMHFVSLEQLRNILGIKIIESVNEFSLFLSGEHATENLYSERKSNLTISSEDLFNLGDEDHEILFHLFRNSKSIQIKSLDGGFSGNLVLKTKAIDKLGHEEVPSVVKIGERNSIAKERDSFEKIKNILGNSAPQITEYFETASRAGIKYRYASMLDEKINTFQKRFVLENDIEKIKYFLNIVFLSQLGRFYKASTREKTDLFSYYEFSDKYLNSVKKNIETITGNLISSDELLKLEDDDCYNLINFYTNDLKQRNRNILYSHYFSYIHGDLNGANILLDGHENVWLIDFFHTHRGHILKDLIKLENDIIYIFTSINDKSSYEEGKKLIHAITDIDDLWNSVLEVKFQNSDINKSYQVIKHLRGFYKELIHTDRDPIQLFIGLLRYSAHTMSFEECNLWQKKLALYTSCHLAFKLSNRINGDNKLRFDYISKCNNSLALTILPGRKDRGRSIKSDVQQIKEAGFDSVVSLLSKDEYFQYGVEELLEEYKNSNIHCYDVSIMDQCIPSFETMHSILNFIDCEIKSGKKVLVHCVGGLGRSGIVAACFLKKFENIDSEKAIQIVRDSRSKRAIESKIQEDFVIEFI